MSNCPSINGNLPTSSTFLYMMGLEPLQLSATIYAETAPRDITYSGLAGTYDMKVVKWKQNESNEIAIQAFSETYFWRNKKITLEMNNIEEGIPIQDVADEIEQYLGTGWTIQLGDGENPLISADGEGEDMDKSGFAFIDVSGSIFNILNWFEEATGTYAYIDYDNKKVVYLSSLPEFYKSEYDKEGAAIPPDGYEPPKLAEQSEGNTTDIEKVTVYGNLNHIKEMNVNVAGEDGTIGIDGYGEAEIYVDAGQWVIQPDIQVQSFTDELVDPGEWEEIDSDEVPAPDDPRGGQGVPVTTKVRTKTYERSFRPVVTAITDSITQDEVSDLGVDETSDIVTPDGGSFENNESAVLKTEYEPPSDIRDENSKKMVGVLSGKTVLTAPVTTQGNAETLAQEARDVIFQDIMGIYEKDTEGEEEEEETTTEEEGEEESPSWQWDNDWGAHPMQNIYIFPFRTDSGEGVAKPSYSLSAFVVSSIPTQSIKYTHTYKQVIVNGKPTDMKTVFGHPPSTTTNTAMIAHAYRHSLLQYLKFTWEFSSSAKRVKFPYAVDSDGNVKDPDDDISMNVDRRTLVVQNNFIPNMFLAKNRAALLKDIANLDVEQGYLDNNNEADLTTLSKFTEVFNGGYVKAMKYIRKSNLD